MKSQALPPILRSVTVDLQPEAAFEKFTTGFAEWWPSKTFSIGGPEVTQIVFEARLGGRIFEEHTDGRRFQWGLVETWEPPSRVKFKWHPSREFENAQDVELEFIPEANGTRVELTASGWERWGEGAAKARQGYGMGWAYVLNVFAGRRNAKMAFLDVMTLGMNFVQKFRGGRAAVIAKSRGEMPPAEEN
ncbi:MAG: SRPBCC domain-containing protein [Pyrinomonadaceae bacterium]